MIPPSDDTSRIDGYHGAYLRIDVSTGDRLSVPIAEEDLRQHLGGSGLGTFLLMQEGAPELDALSRESLLAFVFSPLVGSPLTTSAKFAVVCKSPLTNRLNDSLASSAFAIAGKRTGYDALVIKGRAREPSILIVDDAGVRLEPANDLWGRHCDASEEYLRTRFGNRYQFAVIGPAGERLVRFATVSHDGRHAGRGGSGAVMGSKNLKAIAVRGTHSCSWSNPSELIKLSKQLSEASLGDATAKYRELGTASNLLLFNRMNVLPTRNFQSSSFEAVDRIAPESLAATRTKTRASCAACTIGCEHIYSLSEESEDGDVNDGVRLEYENLFALGPLCGIDDPNIVLRASKMCDRLGIDTISVGGTIAFAMECVDRGILDESWLRFGDGTSLLRAIEMIGVRSKLGDRLAEGSRRFAGSLGHNTLDFAPQVKGLELPGYEPRALQTMALGLAVCSRGADHNRSGAYEADFSDQVDRYRATDDSVQYAIETENKAAIMDSLILCKFLRGAFDDFYGQSAEMLRLVTGWNVTADELRRTAWRIIDTKRHFNVLCGWQPSEDTLPKRFFADELGDDQRARLDQTRFQELIKRYNVLRGWSEAGWPSSSTQSISQHEPREVQ